MLSLARVTNARMLVGTRRSSRASGRATKIRSASKSNASDASVATPIVAAAEWSRDRGDDVGIDEGEGANDSGTVDGE